MILPTLFTAVCSLCSVASAATIFQGGALRPSEKKNGDALTDVRRNLHRANHRRDQSHNFPAKSLSQSLTDTTIFKWPIIGPDITVTCKTCYIGGSVTGNLQYEGNFTEITDSIKNDVPDYRSMWNNLTEWIGEDPDKSIPEIHPVLNLDDTQRLPEAQGHFEFDGLELYLDLDITLFQSATHAIPLFQIPLDEFKIDDLETGPKLSIDLILIASSGIDLESGIHLKIDDGFAFDIDLFRNISSLSLPGGQFEFLPINIQGEGTLQAILSLGMSIGAQFNSLTSPHHSIGAGVETDAFAYLADFTINATGANSSKECAAQVGLDYTLAVGAGAGATVTADHQTWGPTATMTVPIWYTSITSSCAGSKTSTVTPHVTQRAALESRGFFDDDKSSTSRPTSASDSTVQVVSCLEHGVVNCPASFQSTILVTNPPIPSSIMPPSVTSCGSNKQAIFSTTGSPVSYSPTPSPTSPSAGGSGIDGAYNTSTDWKLIVGLCVGIIFPLIVAALIGARYYHKRRFSKPSTQLPRENCHPPAYDEVMKDRTEVGNEQAGGY